MITIQGDEIRKLCLSDMHFTYDDFMDPRSELATLYSGFTEYAAKSDAHYILNYGDMLTSSYLNYLQNFARNGSPNNIDIKKQKKALEDLTYRRLRPDLSPPESFQSMSYLIDKFARASGCSQPLSKAQIEKDLANIRDHDKAMIDYLVKRQNQSGKPFFALHGNHECITLSESEIAGLFQQASGHADIIRTAHAYSFYQEVSLENTDRAPISAREIFYNPNIHNHAKGGLTLHSHDLEWLKDTLADTTGHAIVNMHFPISFEQDPKNDPYSISRTYKEAAQIRKALSKAGNVALVTSGHIHKVLFDQIKGVNYLTMPSFHQIPSTVRDEDKKGLKLPTGYFQEVSLNLVDMVVRVERKRMILNADGTTYVHSERKARHNFAPKSPLKFDI
jgi:predicted phosphodiesterase